MDPGEVCDDGNIIDADGCSANCANDYSCGNGVLDANEICDDANNTSGDGCSADCQSDETCGNGSTDVFAGEFCDDGNNVSGDDCSMDCLSSEVCGNGYLDLLEGELCDDGNNTSGDGCSNDCLSDETCGNGIWDALAGEVCDDGNDIVGDGCSAECQSAEICGDGYVEVSLGEICDDGNNWSGDGCRADCRGIEMCGDGLQDPLAGEICDDGNNQAGDGCRADCLGLERCGDGMVDIDELCDDGNNVGNDRCSANCLQIRPDISLGGSYWVGGSACALHSTGVVRCWGYGEDGRLGYGNDQDIGDNEVPLSAGNVDIGGVVVQMAVGHHSCALLNVGTIRCWGSGDSGKLGYGNTDSVGDNEFPSTAGDVNIGGVAVQVSAGVSHTCALLNTGGVRCWGDGENGKLGYGNVLNVGDDELPSAVGEVNVGRTVTQIAAGSDHTCALLDNGRVRCWGAGSHGQLGYGNINDIGDNEVPAAVGDVQVGETVTQIAAGAQRTCALLATGHVRCWGWGHVGVLGYGNTETIGDDETPASAGDVDVGGRVIQIEAGIYSTCALLETGDVRCWGSDGFGGLGYGCCSGPIGDDETPASAGSINIGGTAIRIDVGNWHTCAMLDNGYVRCWGWGAHGRLGYGNTSNVLDPVSVSYVNIGW